ncbi:MAG: helix-turn-helix transcriptional regulator [Firmicutes bacterium]|nr:helix-turn-helix transcriptional regulator [Bacillota bacterium]
MDHSSLGKNIQKYRKMKGLTQEDLAEMIEVTPHYIGLLERGRRLPSLKRFIAIANSLDVSADLLLLDLLNNRFEIKATYISKRMSVLTKEAADNIYDALDFMIDKAPKADDDRR